MPTDWWASSRLERGPQNVSAGTSVLLVKQLPNSWHQQLCLQWEFQLLLASLRSSSRSAGGSDPSFKLLPLFWNSGHVSLCVSSLRVEFLFPIALMAFKARCCGVSWSQCRTSGLESTLGQTPHFTKRMFAVVTIFLLVGCPPGGMGLYYAVVRFLLPVLWWSLLYAFIWKYFLLVLRVVLINNYSAKSCNFGAYGKRWPQVSCSIVLTTWQSFLMVLGWNLHHLTLLTAPSLWELTCKIMSPCLHFLTWDSWIQAHAWYQCPH